MIDSIRTRLRSGLLVLGLGLSGCNLFNPSGTGSIPDDNADAWVEAGENALQNQDFKTAWTDFSKALALDSSKSLAWHGLAKAELGKDDFDVGKLVKIGDTLSKAPDSSKIMVLVGMGDSSLTAIYRPLMRVASIYDKFRQRDSAGRSDGIFGTHLILNELNAIMNNRSYFLLIDANRDTIIQHGELAGLKLMSLSGGSLAVDPQKLIKEGGMDSTTGAIPDSTRDNINGILNNVSTIAADTNALNKLLAGMGSSGSTGGSTGTSTTGSGSQATDQMNQDARSFIQKLGSSTSFFLVNDSLDNDGDGCINEEIFGDSTDNDGDSLVDEDGRIGLKQAGPPEAGKLALLAPDDGFRNDKLQIVNGAFAVVPAKDDMVLSASLPPTLSGSLVWGNSTGVLKPYLNLRWVRWDDHSSGNDTIYHRVMRENGITDTTMAPAQVDAYLTSKGKRYLEFRTLAIVEVRKKVLAVANAVDRVKLGRKIVGGCWDNVDLP